MKGKGRSKAFTLVELIAVILILSVLAMIATPMVSNVVAESRKNSFGVTCKQVYNAVEKYANFEQKSTCVVFDFDKNLTESEMIDGKVYQPVSKLQLTGTLPRKGQAKLCDGIIEVYADDGENTCLVTEEVSNVLSGTLENIDITAPVLESITLTSTTSTVTVVANAKEEDGKIVKYYYSLDGRDYKESELNTYTFSKLKMNTEYKVYVRAENESGLLSERKTAMVVTKQMNNPVLTQTSQVPDVEKNYKYASKRVIKIEYNIENVVEPVYYFKTSATARVEEGNVVAICGTSVLPGECTESSVTELVADTWYKGKDKEIEVTYEVDGVLYAATGDGTNISGMSTYTISDMDATGPSAKISVGSVKTSQATITATCYDDQTGITKYEYSKDNGVTWVDKGTTSEYTFTKLTSETAYTFVVRCTNGSGLTATDKDTSTTKGLINPSIEQISQIPDKSEGFEYATQRVIKITYKNNDIVSPEYYFKSTVNATVDGGVVIASCGTKTTPEICTTSSVTTLVANTWYRTNNIEPNFNYTSNGTLYALISDGTNISGTATWTIDNIDISEPEASLEITDVKTSETTLKATCKDNQSGIIKYEYSKDNGVTWVDKGTSSTYTFKELKQGTEYEYVVRCTNGTGILSTTAKGTSETKVVANPGFELVSQTPSSGYEYYTSRTIKIKYVSTDVVNPVYYLKTSVGATVESGVVKEACGTGTTPGTCVASNVTTLVAGTWYKVSSETPNITYTANGTLYAATGDGTNLSGTATYGVSNIDTSDPSVAINVSDIKTDRATVTATCSDSESGITKYEFSKDDGKTWIDKGKTNTYTFTGLTQGTNYTYAVRCTNGSSLTSRINSNNITASIVNPEFSNTSNIPNSGYSYYTSRTYKITYSNTNITSPEYYFKVSVEATVPTGTVSGSCGTGTTPGKCTGSSVTTLVAGTWYKTNSTTPSITLTKNGTIYALTSDGLNTSGTSTYAVSEIDTSEPSASLSVGTIRTDRVTLTATCADSESGITKYEFSKDGGSTYTSNGTNASYTYTGLTQGKEYTFGVRCTNGSALTKTATQKSSTVSIVNPTFTNTSNTPSSGYSYYTSRTYRINYSNSNVTNPTYYFKTSVTASAASGVVIATCGTGTNPSGCSASNVTTLVAGTWYKTNSTTPSITYTANGTLYAATSDGTNLSGTSTYGVSEIDTSKPNVSLSVGSIKTDRVTLTANCSDSESGITKYEFSKNGGSTYTNNGTSASYTYTGLTSGTEYTFAVRCTNGSGVTNTNTSKGKPVEISKPTFTNTSNSPSSGYSYYTSRTYRINYSSSNVANPKYYFKSSVSATVGSGVVIESCGTGTVPSGCSSSSVTLLVAGAWYRTNSSSPSLTYTANGTIYAAIGDGTNLSQTSTYAVSEIDTTKPTLSVSSSSTTSKITLSISANDNESGIVSKTCEYGANTNYGSTGTISGNECVLNCITHGKTYYYRITTTNGSGMTETVTGTKATSSVPTPTITEYSRTPATGTYATTKVMRITYSGTGVTTPSYYYSTNGSTWTRVYGTTDVTYTSNGTIYAKTVDECGNTSSTSTPVSGIDSAPPGVEVSVSGYNVSIKLTDNVNLTGYAITSTTTTPSSWTSTSGTSKTMTWSPSTYGAYGTYYVWAKDASGLTTYKAATISASAYNYAATPYCTGGRTLSNGNCIYSYTNNESKCGCDTYDECEASSCGVKHYNECQTSACGYNTCEASACGVKSCQNPSCTCYERYECPSEYYCGCKTYASCPLEECGCSVREECEDSSCGVLSYISCPTSGCGYATCSVTGYKWCTSYSFSSWAADHFQSDTDVSETECRGYASCTYTSCSPYTNGTTGNTISHYECSVFYANGCATWGGCSSLAPDGREEEGTDYITCTKTATNSSCGYATCPDPACGVSSYKTCQAESCNCKTYKSCANVECGCATANSCKNLTCACKTYNSCTSGYYCGYYECEDSSCGIATCENSACGIKEYYECEDSSCGCKIANSCTLTENSYRSYSCPKGGTLSGSTCRFDI